MKLNKNVCVWNKKLLSKKESDSKKKLLSKRGLDLKRKLQSKKDLDKKLKLRLSASDWRRKLLKLKELD